MRTVGYRKASPITFSASATLEDLKTLIRALNEKGADYLLIGGYALFAHGHHRATTDIDVLVPATLEAGQKVREALFGRAAAYQAGNARQGRCRPNHSGAGSGNAPPE